MERKYTVWQRLLSDKPTFFKRAQIFGLGLVTLSVSLAEIKGLPEQLSVVLASIGASVAAISQFAVKQLEPVD